MTISNIRKQTKNHFLCANTLPNHFAPSIPAPNLSFADAHEAEWRVLRDTVRAAVGSLEAAVAECHFQTGAEPPSPYEAKEKELHLQPTERTD
jgi:hypothetical protein